MKIFSKEKDGNRITFNFFGIIKLKLKDETLSITGVKAHDVCSWEKEVFPSEKFVMPEMKDIFGKKHKYIEGYERVIPPFYVRGFKDGICYSNREEVFASPTTVIEEYTTQKTNTQIGQSYLDLSKVKHIKGTVAHLSLSGLEDNYFHWLVECLGRLYLIKKAGVEPDYYIVSRHKPFQKQYLELLGIDENKIIPTDSNQLIQADELIVPSFINNWEYVNYRGYKHYQKQWLPSWIGNLYKENVLPAFESIDTKKIYVTRKNARYRKIINEHELIDYLTPLGFEVVDLDNMSAHDQINLFQNTKSIVTVHGSSLTNLLFASKDINVLEIYPQNYLDSAFRILGKALGIENYFYLVGEFDKKQKNIHPQQEDVYVNIEKLKKIFEVDYG